MRAVASLPRLTAALLGLLAPRAAASQSAPAACLDATEPSVELACDPSDTAAPPSANELGDAFGRLPVPRAAPTARRERAPVSAEPRPFEDAELALARGLRRFLCNPAAQASSSHDTLLLLRYRRATVYYRAGQYDVAVPLFRDLALEQDPAPDPEGLRALAAELLLDSLNELGAHAQPARPACFDLLAEELPRLLARQCAAPETSRPRDLCWRLEALQCQTLERGAATLLQRGQPERAAQAYLALATERPQCQGSAGPERALYNAAEAFDRASLPDRAESARAALVQRFLPRRSPLAQRALLRLAQDRQARAEYEAAAEAFEQLAAYLQEHPSEALATDREALAQGAEATRTAALLRATMGDDARAEADLARLRAFYGAHAALRPIVAAADLAQGEILLQRAERLEQSEGPRAARPSWSAAQRYFQSLLLRHGRTASAELLARSNVALGRALLRLGLAQQATPYLQAASLLAGAPGATEEALEGTLRARGLDGPALQGALATLREAAAEAAFLLRSLRADALERGSLPRYRGPAQRAPFDAWRARVLEPALEQLQRELEGASVDLTASPAEGSRVWLLAALHRSALLHERLAAALRAAVPSQPSSVAAWTREVLSPLASRLEARALQGYTRCLQRAELTHAFDASARACLARVAALDPSHPAEELFASAPLLYSRAVGARPAEEPPPAP